MDVTEDDAPAGVTCPACGERGLSGERWCEGCGADLTPTVPGAADPAASPCPACGGAFDVDGWCGTCGAPRPLPRDHWSEHPAPWLAGVCDRGVRHHRNEDALALALLPGGAALVVCDGVSSADASDEASLAAARAAADVLAAVAGSAEPAAPPAAAQTAELMAAQTADLMARAVAQAQAAVVAVARDRTGAPRPSPPSCTIVAALITGVDGAATRAELGWVGDSRAYWLPDGGEPVRLTTDDSWAAEQVRLGVPEADAEAGPRAHTITRWLGPDAPAPVPHRAVVVPDRAGWLLLCSDGLWNYCSPAPAMADLVRATAAAHAGDAAATAAALVAWANGRGGHDNITVALARLGDGPSPGSHDDVHERSGG